MQARDVQPCAGTNTPESPPALLATLAERLSRTMAVARALILAGRTVDLTGIEDGVGVVCAKTLDLPLEQARAMLPALHAMLAQIDNMDAALRWPKTERHDV